MVVVAVLRAVAAFTLPSPHHPVVTLRQPTIQAVVRTLVEAVRALVAAVVAAATHTALVAQQLVSRPPLEAAVVVAATVLRRRRAVVLGLVASFRVCRTHCPDKSGR
jgi:hypothetical protein